METCILCTSELPSRNKPEHVLLNALGGRKTSARLICSECNSQMGQGPDKELAESVAAIRAISGFRAGDGKQPPTLRNALTGTYGADIRDGKLSPNIKKPLKVEKLENGLTKIEIKARTTQQLEILLESGFEQLKIPNEKREALRKQFLASAKIEHKPPPPVELNFSFGSTEALRSMAKSVFEIWALQIGNVYASSPEYDQIRAYITKGVHADIVEIDTRPLPAKITQEFLFPNFIWAGSDDFGNVWGYFSLYSLCAWSIKISKNSRFKNLSIGIISNPASTESWKFGPDVGALIDIEWVKAPEYDERHLQTSFMRLHQRNHEKSFGEFVRKCIAEAMERTGTQLGDKIGDDFINYLSHLVASAVAKLPWEEPLERKNSSSEGFSTSYW